MKSVYMPTVVVQIVQFGIGERCGVPSAAGSGERCSAPSTEVEESAAGAHKCRSVEQSAASDINCRSVE